MVVNAAAAAAAAVAAAYKSFSTLLHTRVPAAAAVGGWSSCLHYALEGASVNQYFSHGILTINARWHAR